MSDTPANPPRFSPQERMDKSQFFVVPLAEADDDNAFWHAQSPQSRLAALERLRQIAYGDYDSSARLQRLLAVAPLGSR